MSRPRIRQLAAVLSVTTAVLYFVIATETVRVVDGSDEPNVVFLVAGILFLAAAFVIVRVDRRLSWLLLAGFDAFIIWAYFQVAADRTPAFEIWGVSLRVPQLLLLVALIYLLVRPTLQETRYNETRDTQLTSTG